MTNNNQPSEWNKQQSNIPKAWGKSAEKANEQKASAVNGSEPIQDDATEPIVETSDHTVKDDNSNSAPAEQKPDNKQKPAENDYKVLFDGESESDPDIKKHKAARKSIIVLVILLIAVVSALVVFIVLYFSGKSSDKDEKVSTTSIAETSVAETVEATEKPTEVAVTEATTTTPPTTVPPTTAPIATTESTTLPKSTEKPTTPTSFEEYTIWLEKYTITYEKPYPRSGMTGQIEISTLYTIVDEEEDVFGNLWGKLKSGKGWVNLSGTYYEGAVSTDTVSVEINADHDSANDDKVSDNIGVYITETQDVPDFDGSGYGHRIIIYSDGSSEYEEY